MFILLLLEDQMNYTYMLRCSDGTLYTGWTNDIEKRVRNHNSGHGAKYTRCRRPVELVYYEIFDTKEEAMKREADIKKHNRAYKENLLRNFTPDSSCCPKCFHK